MWLVYVLLAIIGIFLGIKIRDIVLIINRRHKVEEVMSFYDSAKLTSLPVIPFTVNGETFSLLLDTGSDVNLIHLPYVGLGKSTGNERSVHAGGGDIGGEIYKVSFDYKDRVSYEVSMVSADLSHTFDYIKKENGVTIHGILGSQFFIDQKWIVDFDELAAYSK